MLPTVPGTDPSVSLTPGTPVLVRFPRAEAFSRDTWPWLPGYILSECGDDEWQIVVEVPELATKEDGSPVTDGTPEDEWHYPVCFRDSTEIRLVDAP